MAWKEEYVNYQILERPSRIHNTIYFFLRIVKFLQAKNNPIKYGCLCVGTEFFVCYDGVGYACIHVKMLIL